MPIGYEDYESGSHEPRRTKSLPAKYMIPSEEVGEYESANSRRRSAPAKPPPGSGANSGLYPLGEQGTYGAAPKRPGMPPSGPSSVPFSRIRERKPKVYSSYNLDSNCQMHAKKLAKAERNAEQAIRKHSSTGSRPGSRSGSVSGSISRASPSPVRRYSSYGGGGNGGGSIGNGHSSRASSSGRSSRSPEPFNGGFQRQRRKSSEKSYSSYGGGSQQQQHHSLARRSASTSSFRGGHVREIPISIEERNEEEYSYAENNGYNNQRSTSTSSLRRSSSTRNSSSYSASSNSSNNMTMNNGFSSFRKSSGGSSNSGTIGRTGSVPSKNASLDGLRKPKIDSWDSMGILGLTTKIWNDTRKRQETFMESTGHFLREESSSYIM